MQQIQFSRKAVSLSSSDHILFSFDIASAVKPILLNINCLFLNPKCKTNLLQGT